MSRAFAILFPIQETQITAWCWNSACGHGEIGAVNIGDGLPLAILCGHEDCPHLDRQMDVPMGEVDGRMIYLRKLKEVDE